jgi:hypothetical protein
MKPIKTRKTFIEIYLKVLQKIIKLKVLDEPRFNGFDLCPDLLPTQKLWTMDRSKREEYIITKVAHFSSMHKTSIMWSRCRSYKISSVSGTKLKSLRETFKRV